MSLAPSSTGVALWGRPGELSAVLKVVLMGLSPHCRVRTLGPEQKGLPLLCPGEIWALGCPWNLGARV